METSACPDSYLNIRVIVGFPTPAARCEVHTYLHTNELALLVQTESTRKEYVPGKKEPIKVKAGMLVGEEDTEKRPSYVFRERSVREKGKCAKSFQFLQNDQNYGGMVQSVAVAAGAKNM